MIPSLSQLPPKSTLPKRIVQGVVDLIGIAICFTAFLLINFLLV